MKLITFFGLALANFSYQWLFVIGADYMVAFERTYFMGVALLTYHVLTKVKEAIE